MSQNLSMSFPRKTRTQNADSNRLGERILLSCPEHGNTNENSSEIQATAKLEELGNPSHSEIRRARNYKFLVPTKPLLDSGSYIQLYWLPVPTKPLLDSSSYVKQYTGFEYLRNLY